MGAYITISVLMTAIAVYIAVVNRPSNFHIAEDLNAAYDYIIVGAGSAGSVVAARLSEEQDKSILLLEAGPHGFDEPMVDIGMFALLMLNTKWDWAYSTVPQKHSCRDMHNQQSAWARGKLLGGCSSHNHLVYMRGNKYDYYEWASMGATGWSYRDVLPYFIKSENNQNRQFVDSGYHGNQGPLPVQDVNMTEFSQVWLEAGQELGYQARDVNGAEQEGFMHAQATIFPNGVRGSTARAYLLPAMTRYNLHVATEAFVTKVLFEDKKAVGVTFIRDNVKQHVYARKEVILSAGAIGSPHILLLSGVGPQKHLDEMKIPVVADLPVGNNLQDHLLTFPVAYTFDSPLTTTADEIESISTAMKYHLFGTGMWATGIGLAGYAFIKSPNQPLSDPRPYIEYSPGAGLIGSSEKGRKLWATIGNFREEIFNITHPIQKGKHGATVAPSLQRPKSRGTIRLNTTDPFDQPLIDPNYLAEYQDVQVLIDAIRFARSLEDTKAFKRHGAVLEKVIHPECSHHQYDSDAYWECYVRHETQTLWHPVGTCKMGAANDRTAVVDPELRVHGLKGLRVVDTSIMPNIVTGNTNAPAIMIGEKAADLIRAKVTVAPAKVLG